MTHNVLYIGGPKHGECWTRDGDVFDAPKHLYFPTFEIGRGAGEAIYEQRPLADTPGAITYIYAGERAEASKEEDKHT